MHLRHPNARTVVEAFAILATVVFALVLELLPTGSLEREAFASGAVALASIGAAVTIFATSGLRQGRYRIGWQLIGVGIAAWALAEVIWLGYSAVGADPFPSLADVLYLAGYPALAVGSVVLAAPGRVLARLRVALEGTAIACAIATPVWLTIIWPSVSASESVIEAAVVTAYPFMDVVLLVAILTAMGARGPSTPVSGLLWLIAGVGATVAADFAFALEELGDGYTPGLIDVGFFAGYTFITLSALTWPGHSARHGVRLGDQVSEPVWSQYAVLAVAPTVTVLYVAAHLDHSHSASDYVFVGITLTAVLATSIRHAVAQFDQVKTNSRLVRIGEDLQAASAEAERTNRAKSEFLSRMSHELRTPMNSILGFGQLLQMDVLTSDQRDNVALIMSSGRHLLHLIDEVLDISRIEAGKLDLSIEPFPPDSVVTEVVEMIRPLALAAGIALEVQSAHRGTSAVGDVQRTKQVLLNLVSNAVKYNRPGGSVTLRVEAGAGERVHFSVTDTGIGIPADKIQRLFSPFDRLGAERTGIEGTGLGLMLSRVLVEAMSGALTVDSVEGKGSTFTVELPAASVAERSPTLGAARNAASAGITVLYVEDNLANFGLLEHAFRQRGGVRLLAARSGAEGFAIARESPPHLVLLDHHLPDMTGLDVLELLKKDSATADIPVVILTASTSAHVGDRARRAGAMAVLVKPLDLDQLYRTVGRVAGEPPVAAA